MAMDSRELDSPLVDLDGLAADMRADLHADALHIQAAVGSDRDSPGSLKRAGLDLDGDQSTAKKRRKQSKPVRINAPDGAATAALDGGTVDGAALLGDALAEVLGSAGRVSPSLDLEVQVHCQTDGDGRDEIPLNLCSLAKTEPSSPVDDFAPFAANKSPGMDVAADLPPTPQDRLAMNSFWGMSPPFLYPMMAPQSEQPLGAALPPQLQPPPPLQPPMGAGMPLAANNHQSRCSPDNRTGSCTIFNPDAYCELCNKEFCNKYFLKTHKANKHGIFTSSPGQQQQQQQGPQPLPPLQPQQPSPGGGDAYQHGLLPPLPPQHRPLSPGSDKLSPSRLAKDLGGAKHAKSLFQRKIKVKQFGANGDEVSVTPVVKVEDDYYDADVLLSRLSPLQDDKQGPAEDGGEGGNDSNESTGILRKEMQQEVPEKPVFTPEKMRSLGVINPEAFCEICCKEYCNKYFLRTHKWKRHGIAPPEGEDKESSSSSAASSRAQAPSWLQQLQQHAAPLNLIMEEATSSGDALCKYCGQWFPTEQVLQVHVAFAHLPVKKEKQDGEDGRKEEADKPPRKADQIESIMDDMKKVQSMLFQLNSLSQQGDAALNPADDQPSRESPSAALPCSMCKKSFPDKAALQQHAQDHHWSVAVKTERDADAAPPGRAAEAAATAAAEQPLQQQQQPAPATPQAVPEPKPVTSTPTSSYCEICNKELCNKYFMKTHMQRMHGIEIENGSQIGGVVCDICNKELCSKYFLRVHKQNTHGIVDESSGPPSQVRGGGGGGGGGGGSGAGDAMFGAHFLDGATQALKPTDLSEMSHRYFTHFNEVCTICNRRFRSVKWLKAHLMNDHGRSEYEAAAETNDRLAKLPPPPGPGHGPGHGLHPNDLGVQLGLPMPPRERSRNSEGKSRHGRDGGAHAGKNGNHFMANLMQGSKEYRCSYCPFSTPVLAFLYVHEKTHTGMAYLPDQKRDLQCPICFKTCTKPDQFQRHILSHQFAGLPGPGAAMFAGLDPRAAAMFHQPAKREKPPPPPPQQQQQQPPQQRATPERQPDDGDLLDGFRKCAKCGGEAASGCANCGYADARKDMSSSLQSLLKDTVTSDVKKRLEDAAKLNDIPASYAVPKQTQDLDPFIMQPFIIEEPRGDAGGEHLSPALDKKFVPSLVFLPVKERLSRPLTASFTLTPA